MNADWQSAIAALVVLAAAAYVLRVAYRAVLQRNAGCGACSTCPASSPESKLVALNLRGAKPRIANTNDRQNAGALQESAGKR